MEYLGKLLVYPYASPKTGEESLVAELMQYDTGGVLYLDYDENWIDSEGNKLLCWKTTGIEYDTYRKPPNSLKFIKNSEEYNQEYVFKKITKPHLSPNEVEKALKWMDENMPDIFIK